MANFALLADMEVSWPVASIVIVIVGTVAKLCHDLWVSHRVTKVEAAQTAEKPLLESYATATNNRISHVESHVSRVEKNVENRMDRIEARIGRLEKQIDDVLDTLMELSK